MNLANLDVKTLPLVGKHLIEASAGTGKTHNITRIYLRLLLEKRLSVEQILVMTFTKDATDELRGRIDAFIRFALNNWSTLVANDDFFIAIAKNINADEAQILLKKALLFLDEAAIFTIHGFCKRVLSQHAFASGLSFNAHMESNCQDLVLESCQDFYRVIGQDAPRQFLQLAEFWPSPDSFIQSFYKAIARQGELDLVDEQQVIEHFFQVVTQAIKALEDHHASLTSYLIDVKKGAERQLRIDELNALTGWLTQVLQDIELASTKMPDAFIDGRRFSRAVYKQELVDIFAPVNQVKVQAKEIGNKINRARALMIVREGIYRIRAELTDKKQQLNMLSFDDLITTLADRLTDSNHEILAQLLFEQYPVALVDEFQDTDPQQFAILQALYYQQPTAALYMIGDPKQAIYGFRGGDIFAYLSARQGCDYQWLMDTNWRSSAPMIAGYNRLFYGESLSLKGRAVFGYGIPYIPVKPSPAAINMARAELESARASICNTHAHNDQSSTTNLTALQFVHFSQDDQQGSIKQHFRPVMASWCANEIVRLLSNEQLTAPMAATSGSIASDNKLKAQDIAILVRDGTEAAEVKQALDDVGLAAVFMSNRANLLHSEQTQQLLQVLKGILFIENERLYCAALASPLFIYRPEQLFQLQQDEFAWQELKFAFSALRDEWQHKGFISMALKLMHEHFCLPAPDKDRALTNLLHLFELLQAASQRHRQPQELLFWFEQQCRVDNPEVEAELRLESDDNLIRIITQHGAKGLEFPIVFIPFATRHKSPLHFGNRGVSFIEYHDNAGQLILSLDGSIEAKQAMASENYAETIRLLYVAITRAKSRCYVLTTAFEQYQDSPLGRTMNWQKDQDIALSLAQLANDNPDAISVLQVAQLPEQMRYQATDEYNEQPTTATFTGKIERDWWLSSFSALSKNLRHGGVSSPDRDNEHGSSLELAKDNALPREFLTSSLLRFNLAKGAHSGNLLHDILEHTDFGQPDWQQVMKWPLIKYGELTLGFNQQDLQQWLTQVLHAPLSHNEFNGAFCLADISLQKTLRESEFYFPMSATNSRQLAAMLTEHRNAYVINDKEARHPASGQLKPSVQLPAYQRLKGMMHGFVDLIFEHENKYYVCDYKSSHLGDDFQHYSLAAMQENIESNYYDLQYLIYSLALHRHLKVSLPNYDPAIHFGGIYYFYLRGMTNQAEHRGRGIYFRPIRVAELTTLDAIFQGDVVNGGQVNA